MDNVDQSIPGQLATTTTTKIVILQSNDYKKVSGDQKQNTFLFEQLYRSPDLARIHSQLTSVSIFNAVLSITTFLGNALILVQCSSQLVFTSSTVQTLASQLYSNRCLFCSDCTASVRDFVGDCGE